MKECLAKAQELQAKYFGNVESFQVTARVYNDGTSGVIVYISPSEYVDGVDYSGMNSFSFYEWTDDDDIDHKMAAIEKLAIDAPAIKAAAEAEKAKKLSIDDMKATIKAQGERIEFLEGELELAKQQKGGAA